jgi:hypothetical protein
VHGQWLFFLLGSHALSRSAIEHQLVLATRTVRDFIGCGVQIVNPFESWQVSSQTGLKPLLNMRWVLF